MIGEATELEHSKEKRWHLVIMSRTRASCEAVLATPSARHQGRDGARAAPRRAHVAPIPTATAATRGASFFQVGSLRHCGLGELTLSLSGVSNRIQ